MDQTTVVELVKERLGIKTAVRDNMIAAIVRGVIQEMEDEKGLALNLEDPHHLMFCVDFATWRYQNPGGGAGMPRDLQFRLHNMMIHAKAEAEVDTP